MTGYERDFIYKIIPELTRAVKGLTEELKRYNDSHDKNENENSNGSEETKK